MARWMSRSKTRRRGALVMQRGYKSLSIRGFRPFRHRTRSGPKLEYVQRRAPRGGALCCVGGGEKGRGNAENGGGKTQNHPPPAPPQAAPPNPVLSRSAPC